MMEKHEEQPIEVDLAHCYDPESEMSMKEMIYELVRCAVCHHSPATFSIPNLVKDFVDVMDNYGQNEFGTKSAVTPQESVGEDLVTCLECGYQGKMLTSKHMAIHGLTIAEYKDKWGFKKGQSLLCLSASKKRSKAAKKRGAPAGLLKSIEDRRNARAAATKQEEAPAPKPKRTRTPVVEEAPVVEEKRPETRRRRRQTEEEAA